MEQERHLAEDREERDEIARIISRRAADMGIDTKNDYRTLVGGLLSVMDEAGRGHLIQQAVGYVDQAEAEMSIPSDPSLIAPIAAYLATMAEGRIDGGVLARSVELALEEALANAIYHGNLDLPSPRDDDDLEELGELVSQRLITPPYRSRRVRIFIKRSRGEVTYVIEDEGKGFVVESPIDSEEEEALFGRGLLIMRTLATSVKFNTVGNRITLQFDLTA
jgi:anti-sigma regulatory factor (Ser/Thr protein kinase)